jgi:hypothetical protein
MLTCNEGLEAFKSRHRAQQCFNGAREVVGRLKKGRF